LKTGLLAVADGGSAMAKETAQDMGLDQFLEAGEAAGGHHAAAGSLTSEHAIMLMLMSLFHYREKTTASPVGALPVDKSEFAGVACAQRPLCGETRMDGSSHAIDHH
jgi:hypothetical protein